MSGHGSSRRRNYGKRQKDLRDRRASELSVDLEGPASWPRGGGWDAPFKAGAGTDHDQQRSGGTP